MLLEFSHSTRETLKVSQQNLDYDIAIRSLKYDTYIYLGALILFFIILFFPSIAINKITLSFVVFNRLLQHEIPNWILIIFGGSYLLMLIIPSVVGIFIFFNLLKETILNVINKFRNKKVVVCDSEEVDVRINIIKTKHINKDTDDHYITLHFLYKTEIYKVNIGCSNTSKIKKIKSILKNKVNNKNLQQLKNGKELELYYDEDSILFIELISYETADISKIVSKTKNKIIEKYKFRETVEKDVKKELYTHINESLNEGVIENGNATKTQLEKLIKIVSKAKTEKNYYSAIIKIDKLINIINSKNN